MPLHVPSITLNNGIEMPVLGFGVFQIPEQDTEQVVVDALEVGYRHLDTAASYGNEAAVGRAIARSGIPRNELFITTKLWIQEEPAEANAARALEASLGKLGLDYLDLYLIHQPFGDYYGEWRAMEAALAAGTVKAIGVANFHTDRLVDLILHSQVTPAVNQIETHPFYQRSEDHDLLAQHGVIHESWGPFAEGKNNLFSDPTLTGIGEAHGKSVAQVVLRWLTQQDIVVIPKSVNRGRMKQNAEIFDFDLTEIEMATIAGMDTGESLFFSHRDPAAVERIGGRKLDS